jgi:hypothetical protein
MKCVTGSHKGHDVVDMADIITKKKESIKRVTEEIETNVISKSKKQDSEAEKKISECIAHFSDLMKKGKDKRKQWHQEVDDIFDHLDTLTQSLRDYQITALKSYQSQLRSQNSSMFQTIQENKEILKSNNVSDVNNYESKLTELRKIPPVPDLTLPSLKTSTIQGRELGLELKEFRAKLTQSTPSNLIDEDSTLSLTNLLKEAKVIANIPTNVEKLCRIACAGSDRAWISGEDEIIRCFDIHGTVTDTVTSQCSQFPGDIAVNRKGELIYSDAPDRTVNIVRHGKIKSLFTTPQGWHPRRLCCTKSGDILVSMCTTDKSHFKIVRYHGKKVTQETQKDEHGKPIYQGGEFGLYVTENIIGDIVTSNPNAREVVGVDRTGKVRFRYNDKPPGGQQPFCPTKIVTDPMGHILVGDDFNKCLHILDENGRFLRCVDSGSCRPRGLSVDSEGRLWVGLYESGEVKVIQYMK